MVKLSEVQGFLPKICKQYRIAYVEAFGSIARGDSTEKSDIDLIVEFEEPREEQISDRYFGLLHALEDQFKTRVDLLTPKSIRNPYLKKSIDKDRTRIYG